MNPQLYISLLIAYCVTLVTIKLILDMRSLHVIEMRKLALETQKIALNEQVLTLPSADAELALAVEQEKTKQAEAKVVQAEWETKRWANR